MEIGSNDDKKSLERAASRDPRGEERGTRDAGGVQANMIEKSTVGHSRVSALHHVVHGLITSAAELARFLWRSLAVSAVVILATHASPRF